jgi:signal peptidase I
MVYAAARTGKRKKVLITSFGAFLIPVLVFGVIFWFNFRTVEVKGDSMEPTFHSGQHLLISRAYWLVGPIKRNDIIVMKKPDTGETIIKRVYGMPGDTVDFYNVPENWSLANGEYTVPADSYFVLGDNRPVSEDSRTFGPVKANLVLGKVIRAELGWVPPTVASR